ncbi:MAG: ThiF family adenylyltransferase [Hylemonella sp.]|nr:ThiF family adenylyltransferase [Hylemonella sp.]
MEVSLTLSEQQCHELARHLFPSDGCEAVALILCGRAAHGNQHRLLARRIELIPYAECSVRTPDLVTWSTERLIPLLAEAEKKEMAIVKIHGHKGFNRFSATDDSSDQVLFPSIHCWLEQDLPHGSAILMEDGRCFGRVVDELGYFTPFSKVTIVGDDIEIFHDSPDGRVDVPKFGHRVAQTFGQGTYDILAKLRVGVIGCSGTGSPVVEQLARNCVGSLVLVDPDHIEFKNLNRIYNSTAADASEGTAKVEVLSRAISAMGLGTQVEAHTETLFNRGVVKALSTCDVVIGCMDSVDGRYALNKIASFYMIPYLDLGVRIDSDGKGGVDQVCGSVHYVKPGGSSLLSRNLLSMEQVRVAGLRRTDPGEYKKLLEEGYIRGVQEDRPAVIQLNTLIASIAINELLARLHPYRSDPNGDFAVVRVSVSHAIYDHEPDGPPCAVIGRHMGRGDVEPLLDMSELSEGVSK